MADLPELQDQEMDDYDTKYRRLQRRYDDLKHTGILNKGNIWLRMYDDLPPEVRARAAAFRALSYIPVGIVQLFSYGVPTSKFLICDSPNCEKRATVGSYEFWIIFCHHHAAVWFDVNGIKRPYWLEKEE